MAARFRVRWLAAWRDITKVRVYWLVAWREIQHIRRWTKTGTNTFAWKNVYVKSGVTAPTNPPPSGGGGGASVTLSVVLSPTSVYGSRVGVGVVTTNPVTAKASKGVGPYTYRWTRSSYSGSITPTIGTPFAASTNFTRDMQGVVPETETGRFKVTATDTKGNRGTAFVDAQFLTVLQSGTGGLGSSSGGSIRNYPGYYNEP